MTAGLDHHLNLLHRRARVLSMAWAAPLALLTFLLVGGAIPQTSPRTEKAAASLPEVNVASDARPPRPEQTTANRTAREPRQTIPRIRQPLRVEETSRPVLRPMDGTAADTDFRSLTSRQSLREIEEALRNVRQSIALSELDAVPRLVASPPFPYPRALTRRGILEGKVVFQLQISMEGEPRVLKILSADHPLLSEAALRWLENCRFTEPRYRGKATDARGQWTVTFASERP